MPICYGGGVKAAEQVGRIFDVGVKKVVVKVATIVNLLVLAQSGHR